MIKFEKILNRLIDINAKEDVSIIQLKSILKIYTLIGTVVHFIFLALFALEGFYTLAGIEFIYFLIMLLMLYFNKKMKSETIASITMISTAILCITHSFLIGGLPRYDIYIFLIIPLMIYRGYKKKWHRIVIDIVILSSFIFESSVLIYYKPIYDISNLSLLIIELCNCIIIFFSLYFFILISKKYNETTIEKLKEDKKVLDKDSKIDHLTGLYNRRSMERYLTILEDQYHITNKPFGLILMDIDFFKKVNDTYGHQAGDKVLSEISRLIVYSLRKSDEVFRYGGEEILAVVTGIQSKEELIKVADGIREDIKSLKIPVGTQDISVTISAGTSLFDGQDMEQIIKRVDEALYTAKNNGRNRVEFL